jgi:carbonic anhydrase
MPAARTAATSSGLAGLALGGLAPALAGTADPPPAAGQSPIDIGTRGLDASSGPALVVDYPATVDVSLHYVRRDGDAGCGVRHREETIQAEVPPGTAFVERGGDRYQRTQFHFHTPSEHTVDGARFPMEMHLVHGGAGDRILVVALFLVGGGHATPQDRVLASPPAECAGGRRVDGVGLRGALPENLADYRYTGSLRTAPYSRGVGWHVLCAPRTPSPTPPSPRSGRLWTIT